MLNIKRKKGKKGKKKEQPANVGINRRDVELQACEREITRGKSTGFEWGPILHGPSLSFSLSHSLSLPWKVSRADQTFTITVRESLRGMVRGRGGVGGEGGMGMGRENILQ